MTYDTNVADAELYLAISIIIMYHRYETDLSAAQIRAEAYTLTREWKHLSPSPDYYCALRRIYLQMLEKMHAEF